MRLAAIAVYPVKSCRAVPRADARVETWGLAGDRRWVIVDADGMFVTQREEPLLATVTARDRGPALELVRGEHRVVVPRPGAGAERRSVSVWQSTVPALMAGEDASAVLGPGLRLAWLDDPTRRGVDPRYGAAEDRVSFADGFPLLLANASSLADLNQQMPVPLPMDRFRPNVVIEGAPAWEEDRWRRIRIGGVAFRIVKPCARCVVTTTDQATGARGGSGGEPLRTLARFRRRDGAVFFGQNLIPDGTGTIRVGDPVEIVDQADSANWVA